MLKQESRYLFLTFPKRYNPAVWIIDLCSAILLLNAYLYKFS